MTQAPRGRSRRVRPVLRTYSRLLAAGFRRGSRYRLAAFGGLVANATFGLLKVAVLFAVVDAAGGEVAGYDVGAMSAYIWISQGLLGSVNLMGRTDIAERIRTGDVTTDFLRPLDVQAAAVVEDVGKSLFALIPRGVPTVTIGLLLVGMDGPDGPLGLLLGALSLLLGITVSCATVYLVAVAGFWMVDNRGLQILYMVLSGFLAGLFVPIALFPGWLHATALATPFPSMLQFPVDVLSGRADHATAALLVVVQVGWLVAVAALGQALTRAGRRRLEVQGG
ncbi:ABC-2 family transporter protein [Nocardioides sp. CFH 31398]|uniref:ABC transporter permease n=1 Tax=Nocardioides sp. CFH 31398 TaxID=2919579 RepID=UPI001F05F717|nr:ABC-2 family transporter protein [Nocardioides sp. CFH 31398]MCH1866668.1 ABC-2 family transporter protein [Nocardioides sp. CFH 31398]